MPCNATRSTRPAVAATARRHEHEHEHEAPAEARGGVSELRPHRQASSCCANSVGGWVPAWHAPTTAAAAAAPSAPVRRAVPDAARILLRLFADVARGATRAAQSSPNLPLIKNFTPLLGAGPEQDQSLYKTLPGVVAPARPPPACGSRRSPTAGADGGDDRHRG
eukprot:scaffold2010_cov301-Prasinococcus_capsulatus_cf.AAC.11